jgi:hypothetical protein
MGKPTPNCFSFSTIFGIMLPWLSTPLPLLAKRPIHNEIEGKIRESWGVMGRPTTMTLHLPFLSLLSFFKIF